MNYIFFGTPEFAAIILEKLIKAGLIPQAVICNPDKPVGRKKIITAPPTKLVAKKYNISVCQPEQLKIENWKLEIDQIDLAIVAAYGQIIPREILEMPRFGFIGVHPSLLPKYRGPTPIQTAILNGDEKTGVSLFLVDEKVDHGPILAQREFSISPPSLKLRRASNFQFSILLPKLAELGADLLIQFLGSPTSKKLTGNIRDIGLPHGRHQNELKSTFTKKFTTQDAYVDLEKDNPLEIDRKIRALNPEPGVWTMRDGKRMKILDAEIIDGKLKLKKIQFEGKKPVQI